MLLFNKAQRALPFWEDYPVQVKVFRSTLLITALTLVVKLAAAVKELVVAQRFGRSDSLDAFLIAFLLPTALVSLVIVALQSALIPTFIRVRTSGNEEGQRLFSSVLLMTTVGMSGAAALIALLAPFYLPYLGSGFSAGKLLLTRRLLYGLLPYILLGGIASCVSAVLNAGERFLLPAAAPLITPLATIAFIKVWGDRWEVFSLVGAAVLGSVLEAVLVIGALKRVGLHFSLMWGGLDDNLRDVIQRFTPLLAASILSGAAPLVDQSMTAMLVPGSVAALSYAGKIVSTVLSVGAGSLGTVLLPHFSKMVAEKDWVGCRETLRKYATLVLATTIPLTAGLMVGSTAFVRILFQRGAFHGGDTEVVGRVLLCYALQIPFYTLSVLLVRFLVSVGRNRAVLVVTTINLALDIFFNLILMRFWGVAGIALSTSLFFVVSAVMLGACAVHFIASQKETAEAAAAGAPPQGGTAGGSFRC